MAFWKRELIQLRGVIARYNGVNLKLPDNIKRSWQDLTSTIDSNSQYQGGKLCDYLRDVISGIPCGQGSMDRWMRTEYLSRRVVIIRPSDRLVIHHCLREQWDTQLNRFLYLLDDIMDEGYQIWTDPRDWECMREILVS